MIKPVKRDRTKRSACIGWSFDPQGIHVLIILGTKIPRYENSTIRVYVIIDPFF